MQQFSLLALLLISCAHLSHGVSPRATSLLQSTVQAKVVPDPDPAGPWFTDNKAPGEAILAGAAEAAGMETPPIEFSQVAFGEAAGVAAEYREICFGLAALYCNDRADGKSDEDFILAVKDLVNSPYYSKAGLIWANQPSKANQNNIATMMKFVPQLMKATGDEKERTALFKPLARGTLEATEKNLQSGKETYEWFQWAKKHGDRFFMISLEGAKHEVAMAYKDGVFSFFDPNSGIVSGNEEQMQKFLYYYFNAALVHKNYAKGSNNPDAVQMDATRFKKKK